MYEMDFRPRRVCPSNIHVAVSDDGSTIERVEFTGGCNGNTKAVALLVQGKPVDEVVELLAGNDCKGRGTSCADQLTIALRQAQENARAVA
ncbi:MAG: TIGR03905 family TSCPD domain-containing protein [Atopobiaceae bacterium]|nr:TIGR03905 family TSCPD domain-containing protein [Atopobiaceae bacterium]